MPGFALSEEQHEALKKILTQLSADMKAEGLLLSDYGGNVLVDVVQEANEMIQTMAALAAGSFVATRELAKLLGEKEFQWIFHMGSKSSIYIQCIASHYLLLAVVGPRTTQGLVKLYVEKSIGQLERLLLKAEQVSAATAAAAPVFAINERAEVFRRSP